MNRPVWSESSLCTQWVAEDLSTCEQWRPIRLGGCPGWSESSLGAHPHCWFCHEAAHIVALFSQKSEVKTRDSCSWYLNQWKCARLTIYCLFWCHYLCLIINTVYFQRSNIGHDSPGNSWVSSNLFNIFATAGGWMSIVFCLINLFIWKCWNLAIFVGRTEEFR